MSSILVRLARAFVASLLLLAAATAVAYAADLGHKDQPYVNGSGGISGSKPESKLWFNDNLWWGSIWDDATQDFWIYKLDPATDNWVKTAARLDDRKGSRADALWDGTSLYVASQAQSDSASSGSNPARLYKFSYDSGTKTYTNLAGGTNPFGIIRTGSKLETLVIAKDGVGTLWATWTQPSGSGRVAFTNHTLGGNDASWSTGVAIPVANTTTSSDDISSIVSFKLDATHNAVGVFWSNQATNRDYFAYHVDGAADTAWTEETALAPSAGNAAPADDHINLKADFSGRVYAVVKNSNDTSGQPEIELLRRPVGGGTWSESVVSTGNTHTRPIVLLDESANTIHVFLTGPTPPDTTGVSGGTIFEKTSSMTTISFVAGAGTARIRDDVSPRTNNPTSTKQNVSAASGIVVLASDDSDSSTPAGHRNYWHYRAGAGGGGGAPVADFTSDVVGGAPGVTVNFSDASTNTPLSWAWNFGDTTSGALNTSTSQNPSHQYLLAGSYTVSLTATNGSGPGTITKTNYIVVTSGGGGGTPITLPADADTQVKVASTTNLGSNIQLRTREENPVASSTYRSYLRFNVQGLTGAVNTVTLRLWVDTASTNTQTVFNTTTLPTWPELTTNGTNAPAIGSTVYGSSTASPAGAYKDITLLPSSIGGNGLVTFALKSSGTTSAYFSSKEGAHAPQLVITQTVSGTAPTANATAATVTEDVAGPVALSGSDPETCELTFVLVTAPTKGTVNFAGQSAVLCGGSLGAFTDTTSVTYTPNLNANGSDSFTYKVNDGTADSAPATATITITPVNDIPTANAVGTSASVGTPKVITLGGGDVETCDLAFTVLTQPTNGTLTGGGTVTPKTCAGTGPFTDTGEVTYTATSGTSDSFTYKVTDGNAADSLSATVTIAITPPNAAPTANATSANPNEDIATTVNLSGSDAETCGLTFAVTQPTHGSVTGLTNPAGCTGSGPFADAATVTYTPAANYNGSDSFTYTVSDGVNTSAPATASITVNPVNDAPVANAASASTPQNTPKVITLSGSDVETCQLGFVTANPAHGSVGAVTDNGCAAGTPNTDSATVTYTPTAGYSGPDSFTYTVNDGTIPSPSATVSITVTASSSTITVPVAFDAHVNSANVNTNYGNLTPIRTREDSTGANTYRPYFQFNVPAFSGSVSSVKLRLFVQTASSSVTQSVYLVGNGWTETAVNWTNAPLLPLSSIGSGVAGTAGAYVEFTLTTPIVSGTTYSFALKSSGSTSVYFNSDDSATNKPELVIVTGP
jgi:PKD repeat protein